MSEQEQSGILGKLGNLFSGKRDAPTPAPVEETPQDTQDTPVAQPPPALDAEAASRALGLPTIVEAIRAIDGHIETLSERQQVLETVVTGLAKTEMERVQDVMKGGDWSKQLYSVSNDGEPMSKEEQAKLPAQSTLKQGESPAAAIMEASQRLRH